MIAQSCMDITLATPLLGGLSPQVFMRRHWQKKPLLVRQAVPGGVSLLSRAQLFGLVQHENVESRLISRGGSREPGTAGGWRMRHGPFARRALPPLSRPNWTLLVQGLDLHVPEARALLDRFRFVPEARLDDLMLSYATDGGGVGPHVDSYDVFLLQARGRRRWRIGPLGDPALVPEAPLKILARFEPEAEWLLEPGDMLYLPPGWAHDGVAEGECLTCSIGFRAPRQDELARELLQRLIDDAEGESQSQSQSESESESESESNGNGNGNGNGERGARPRSGPRRYRDPRQVASAEPGRVPPALQEFAARGVARLLGDPDALARALGEVLSEPKRGVWFDPSEAAATDAAPDPGAAADGSDGVHVDPRTRALYDDRHFFINGEAFRAGGRDARLMRRLADRRALTSAEVQGLSLPARELLADWLAAGWLQAARVQ